MTPTDPIGAAPPLLVSSGRSVYVDLRPKDPFRPSPEIRLGSWRAVGRSLATSLRFLMETEVHVYAFAVAVNILISFYPFLVAIILICRRILHWQAAIDVIIKTVGDYFPDDFGLNMSGYLRPASWQKISWLSLLLLFFTANGIFTPLEVAFNRVWRAHKNRNFLRNQIISLGMIFICGALVLASVCFTTLTFGTRGHAGSKQGVMLHVVALIVTMLLIFLIYWLLPNCKVPVRRLLLPAAAVAILLQLSEYLNLLTWPWLRDKLRAEVPPFVQSISIVFWAFAATLIILAGAEWAARVKVDMDHSEKHPQTHELH